MILLRPDKNDVNRVADLTDLFKGQVVMLVGGAPSLKEQPLELLHRRGVLTAAMNNAAVHFQPDIWISSDRPECYEPQILLDPKIMKFAPMVHAKTRLGAEYNGLLYSDMPNIFFYLQHSDVAVADFLETYKGVPWYNNTLMSSIHILYQLGVRKIILCGSDFGGSADGEMYAHKSTLSPLQNKWNIDLYNGLVDELLIMNKYFESKKLIIMDCSKYSRIGGAYKMLTMEEAVDICLSRFPENMVDTVDLPHCSKFTTMDIKKRIAGYVSLDNYANKRHTHGSYLNNTVVKKERKLKTLI